ASPATIPRATLSNSSKAMAVMNALSRCTERVALCGLVVMVGMIVSVLARTGQVIDLSTARFAGMAAAILTKRDAPPEVAGQFIQLLGQRHRLVEIGQEVPERRAP